MKRKVWVKEGEIQTMSYYYIIYIILHVNVCTYEIGDVEPLHKGNLQ